MAITFEKRRQNVGVVLLAPALIVIAGILGYPIVRSAVIALQDVKLRAGKLDQVWVGLANFRRIFSDQGLQHAALNTLYFSAMEVILVVGIGLGVALLLNQPQGRSGFLRILLVIPWAIAPVANAVLWKWILNSNYGVLNGLLKSFGLIDNYQVWLGTPFSALNFLLLVDVWKSIPFVTLLLLAGLQRVPGVLHRAAFMDGASSFQSFRYITLPAVKDAIGIAVILQTIWSLRVFDLVFVLTRGGPADGTVLLNFLAYRVTFNFLDIGYGAAIANVIFMLTFILAIGYLWLLKPKSTAGAK
ncbi:carbohydrate ABC transporter permease [Sinorhizobium meliloti]|uniref:carbohydrate ABC transporter permease n=1 Tax=Rhizobium meliloti TaxID=382 RepID=UPI000FD24F4C|nr:sugar ABC transporter permease [Sinorhizobium meliloti]RVH17145.1 sugar ABC transporter permease [Sinorhizobium meliloti]RVK25687.1 sugar ABC transporter permease [Sinorhizobium meliloti]RVO30337.1 sugar ABC transporter permease [Sinorhizobium meliloti]RVO86891.1 sugar ABC transporter permease [Sinorhizobium meliloti]RVQ14348.1 sugar ABC transporter permease [Sinorhizobium meliloti]